jgi:nucleoside 2-deoxyribosyltransferase
VDVIAGDTGKTLKGRRQQTALWKHIGGRLTANVSSSTKPLKVFVISPIGSRNTPIRDNANRFRKYIVDAALPAPEFEVERADENASPFAISAAMLKSLVEADICVADITGRNPNVFYELALAHAMDKHVVIMDSDKEASPFDIHDQRAIKYGLMPEEIEEAVKELRTKATHTETNTSFRDMMNPVATAFRTWTTQQQVASSGDTTERLLLGVVERLETKVDRVLKRPSSDSDTRKERPHSIEETVLLRKAIRCVDKLEDLFELDSIDRSIRIVIDAGRQLADPGTRLPDFERLNLFVIDAEEVIREAELGNRITADDLPSRLL